MGPAEVRLPAQGTDRFALSDEFQSTADVTN
jgi:hypothetical protein